VRWRGRKERIANAASAACPSIDSSRGVTRSPRAVRRSGGGGMPGWGRGARGPKMVASVAADGVDG